MWSRVVSLTELMGQLTRILDARERWEREFVIIEVGATGHYIQLAFDSDALYAEAVSNYYLGAVSSLLTLDQELALLRLGWEGPGDAEEDGHENWFRRWSLGTPSATVVTDLANTLVSVYMTGEGETFEIHGAAFEGKGWSGWGDWTDRIPA